jgi:serine/threonine-protein kinase
VRDQLRESQIDIRPVHLRETDPGTESGSNADSSSPEMPVFPGRSDRYQLFGEIARGGMGAVLKGRDVDLGRDLAVKVLLDSHRDEPDLVRRFIEEAQIGGQLQHPGVVPIYELGCFHDRRPYFTMKLVSGRTLAALLGERAVAHSANSPHSKPPPQRGEGQNDSSALVGEDTGRGAAGGTVPARLAATVGGEFSDPHPRLTGATPGADATGLAADLPRFLAIFEAVCQTMAYAHARGVIHRDLKPSNIMVGRFGEVQVMDWGLAKVLSGERPVGTEPASDADLSVLKTARSGSDAHASQAGSVLGTPAYMAPEQARGEIGQIDERSDVFGLGAILCEILTGEPPFTALSGRNVLIIAATGELDEAFARLDHSDAEPELLALAKDCLAAEREDRLRHAGVVAERITAYLAGVQDRLRQAELARVEADARAQEEAKRRELADRLAVEAEARASAERRRRRTTLALAASVLALATLVGLSATYYLHERQARTARAALAVNEVRLLFNQAKAQADSLERWNAAGRAIAAATRTVDDLGDDIARRSLTTLREQIATGAALARADQALLSELSRIRAGKYDSGLPATDAAYGSAFTRAGVPVSDGPAEAIAARLARRPALVKAELATYLDDWCGAVAESRQPTERWRRLLAMAQAADPDPFRQRIRSALNQADPVVQLNSLRGLIAEPEAAELAPATASLLARSLAAAGEAALAVTLLKKAVDRHPADVWLNFDLGVILETLLPAQPDEAIRYLTAARALRQTTGHRLAHALADRGRTREAVDVFRDVERLQPDEGVHPVCLGRALDSLGDAPEARAAFERAVAVYKPMIAAGKADGAAHHHLAMALDGLGRYNEAVAAATEAIRLSPHLAEAHSSLGVMLAHSGQPEKAKGAYREALRIDPNLLTARSNLASQLQYEGQLPEAIGEFRALLRREPHRAGLHYNLGNALWAHKEHAEAIKELSRAFELDPNHIDSLVNLGCVQCDTGALDPGIGTLRDAARRRPTHAKAWINLAKALRKKGDVDALQKLAEQKPHVVDVQRELGITLLTQGRNDEALGPLTRAVDLEPNDLLGLAALGKCESQLGQHDRAVARFAQVTKLAPGDALAHGNLGRALHARGDFDAAIAECRLSIRLKADDPSTHANLASALRAKGDLDNAQDAYQRACTLDPLNADHRFWLGMTLESTGDLAAAVSPYREAVRLRPEFAMARNHLALALFLSDQSDEAIQIAREAVRLHPKDATTHYNLGSMLLKHGQTDESIPVLREAARLDANYPEVLCNLGQALTAKGRFEEALGYLRRGHELGTKRGDWNYSSAEWIADCERLLTGDRLLSAVLKGDKRVEQNAQRLTLAEVARRKDLPATSARFYAESIAAEPVSVADPATSGLRYDAACVAALAGCGKGNDDPLPDTATRAKLRGQARDWLAADLTAWSKIATAGPAKSRQTLVQALTHWKSDPDLAGIRDDVAIKGLPTEEQKSWRALWDGVDAVIKGAATP